MTAAVPTLTRQNLLPTVPEAREPLQTVALGAVDGTTGKQTESVDGFPLKDNDRVLAEMHRWLSRHGIGDRE